MSFRTEEERYIPCCKIPEKVECCDCPNGISSLWDVQDSLEGMYSHEFFPGFKQAWGCERFANDGVRRVEHYAGPFYTGEPSRTGDCYWGSVEAQPGRCCQFGCEETGGIGNITSVSAYMGCTIYEEVPPTDPVYQWHLDCACDDLWVGDSSEWGSLEDCLEYDTNCHCSNDEGAYAGSEAECESLKSYYEGYGITCGDCTYDEVTPGTPGYPRFVSHVAGLSGPCGCNRHYVHLNPLDPLCKDMMDSIEGSDLDPYDCEGCNTYVLVQYHGLDINGDPCPGYPCGLGCVHLCNGADVGCTDCCEGWGYFYCLGYPATLTLCPSESIDLPSSDSDSDCPDPLCCDTLEMLSVQATQDIPEGAIHWQIKNTSSQGYLFKNEEGLYTGGLPPFTFTIDKEKKLFNGKPLNMLSEEMFWGVGKIGADVLGWQIEFME